MAAALGAEAERPDHRQRSAGGLVGGRQEPVAVRMAAQPNCQPSGAAAPHGALLWVQQRAGRAA